MNPPIDGEITRVEHYGLYLRTARGDALVLITDVSNEPIPNLSAAYEVGTHVRVRLLHFVEEQDLYKATMLIDP